MQFLNALVVLATEEGAESGGGLSLVLPHPEELIAGILAFLIVFFFVWRRALPAINRTLEARQLAITGQLSDAENAKRRRRACSPTTRLSSPTPRPRATGSSRRPVPPASSSRPTSSPGPRRRLPRPWPKPVKKPRPRRPVPWPRPAARSGRSRSAWPRRSSAGRSTGRCSRT
jgi:hypothetical protein